MTTPNTAELIAIYQHIKANQLEWDQAAWAVKTSCGTTYCFAGWAVKRAGLELKWLAPRPEIDEVYASHLAEFPLSIAESAADILGLDEDQAERLFYGIDGLGGLRLAILDITGVDPELVTS